MHRGRKEHIHVTEVKAKNPCLSDMIHFTGNKVKMGQILSV